MSTMSIAAVLSEDRRCLIIETRQDDATIARVIYGAPEVAYLLDLIANQRARMVDEVVPTLDPGSRFKAIGYPAWWAGNEMPDGLRALALRHPGFGWLGFVFNRQQAAALSSAIRPAAEKATGLTLPPPGALASAVPLGGE
jgi:hypothetical protein